MAVLALAIGGPIASAQAATSLEPGVHVDPGSPAAKEYALPLNQARQTGSTSSSQPGSEGSLFGAGIKPPGPGGPPHARKRGGHGTGAGASQNPATGGGSTTAGASLGSSSGSEATLSAAALRAARAQGPTGDGSLLALLGGGVVVLVLGGFGGTVLRHNRGPRPSP
jgi:hypothetical protein